MYHQAYKVTNDQIHKLNTVYQYIFLEEKEAMKELIQKALDGLNQSGRVDLDKLNLNQNDKTTQVDFELIKNSITS